MGGSRTVLTRYSALEGGVATGEPCFSPFDLRAPTKPRPRRGTDDYPPRR